MVAPIKITTKQFMETVIAADGSLSPYEIDKYQQFTTALRELKAQQLADTEL